MKCKTKKHVGIECLKCNTRIFSKHRHDFKYCKCGECFVDGGFDYLRYGGNMTYIKLVSIKLRIRKDGRIYKRDYNAL
jgi:hypothetical protein